MMKEEEEGKGLRANLYLLAAVGDLLGASF